MLDLINSLVCACLMAMLAPVAIVFNHSGHWPQRFALAFSAVIMGLQVVAPVFGDFLPDANGLQVTFNLVLAAVVLFSRREIMAVVRITVGAPPSHAPRHPLRRATDAPEEALQHVRGGRGTP